MSLKTITLSVLLGIGVASSVPAFAHHSNVAFDSERTVSVSGTVTAFKWANPHSWIYLDVDDGKGGKVHWELETRPPGILSRAGWSPDTLKSGDAVAISFHPAKDGTHVGAAAKVTLADGTNLPTSPPQGQ